MPALSRNNRSQIFLVRLAAQEGGDFDPLMLRVGLGLLVARAAVHATAAGAARPPGLVGWPPVIRLMSELIPNRGLAARGGWGLARAGDATGLRSWTAAFSRASASGEGVPGVRRLGRDEAGPPAMPATALRGAARPPGRAAPGAAGRPAAAASSPASSAYEDVCGLLVGGGGGRLRCRRPRSPARCARLVDRLAGLDRGGRGDRGGGLGFELLLDVLGRVQRLGHPAARRRHVLGRITGGVDAGRDDRHPHHAFERRCRGSSRR